MPPTPPPAFARSTWLILAVAVVLYVSACGATAMHFPPIDGRSQDWGGLSVLMIGWLGVFLGLFAWYANLGLFAAWASMALRNPLGAVVAGVIGLLISLDALRVVGMELPADEAGVRKITPQALGVAYPLWTAALLLTTAAALREVLRERAAYRTVPSPNPPSGTRAPTLPASNDLSLSDMRPLGDSSIAKGPNPANHARSTQEYGGL
jgi:hypothetical protein